MLTNKNVKNYRCVYTASVICFDVAAKGFQVITQLHSTPVIGWLRGTVAALGFLLVVPTPWGSR